MTTIATDGRSMAGDGRGVGSGFIRGESEVKVCKLSDGRLLGYSGTTCAAKAYIEHLESGGERPKLADHFLALVLDTDGTAQIHYHDDMPDDVDIPAVLGTGGTLALGAMLAGATPRRAVQIACMRDPHSGGTISEVSL